MGDADADATRTTASRRTYIVPIWVRGAALIFGSALVAALVLGLLLDGTEDEVPWPVAAGAGAMLLVGGTLAGVLAGRGLSRRRFLGALLMPVPTVLLAFVVMVGLTNREQDLPEVYSVTIRLFGLLEVPLAVTLFVLAAVQQRESTELPSQPSGPPPLDRELAAATHSGHAATVVREYADDGEGQAHLQADSQALMENGYGLVSVDKRPGRTGIRRAIGEIIDLLLLFSGLGGSGPSANDGRIVATFRQRSDGRPPDPR